MKITKEFAPVTIVLQTEAELREFREALSDMKRQRDKYFWGLTKKEHDQSIIDLMYMKLLT